MEKINQMLHLKKVGMVLTCLLKTEELCDIGQVFPSLSLKWFDFSSGSKILWLYENVHIKLFPLIKLHFKKRSLLMGHPLQVWENCDAWGNSNNKWSRKANWCVKYPIGWITLERQISNTPLPAIPISGLLPKSQRKGLASLGTKTSKNK